MILPFFIRWGVDPIYMMLLVTSSERLAHRPHEHFRSGPAVRPYRAARAGGCAPAGQSLGPLGSPPLTRDVALGARSVLVPRAPHACRGAEARATSPGAA